MSNYSIGSAAVLVGKPSDPLPVSTIRNWTKQYSEFLSPDANPAPGEERRYNDHDVAVLRRIHELRQDRLIESDIVQVLRQSPPIAIEVMPAASPSEPEATPPAALPAQDAPGTAITLAPVLNDLSARIARIEGQTATRQRNTLVIMALIVGVAVLVGVIVGGVLVWMVGR